MRVASSLQPVLIRRFQCLRVRGSFAFEFENCPLCYGPERASIVGAGASEDGSSSIGEDFCGICTGLE